MDDSALKRPVDFISNLNNEFFGDYIPWSDARARASEGWRLATGELRQLARGRCLCRQSLLVNLGFEPDE